MVLVLSRTYLPEGTNGKLACDGQFLCYTIELPWRENEKGVSCIPEGYYLLRKRYSRKFQWHIEVVAVKNRSSILLHPANNALNQLNGCIAPVTELSGAGLGLQSRQAFTTVKKMVYTALKQSAIVSLIVQS
ncbi:hypothetical protein E0I26_16155 [Flavobacterium rhamnosiphilum]|uniref:DUF5675 domain-containing protein n=1 Tax=Flavobacterium rhamnosiphilum TaxID=2541724 RepID=A0A4R5F333_9FLAO|nr:DUF5675 family protein [Flavobacterium rhamnosiphilum]TDE41620.1 hypothetical protein E0I26_16155 [Flavobacterium rhamnosiphilum]